MTNKRITELTALDGDDVANDDVLVIVDVSDTTMAASGTNKKITVAELVTDSALTGAFWPNSSTALTGSNVANGDKLAVVDVGSPDVAKYITADELAQMPQLSSRYKPLASDSLWIPGSELAPVSGSPVLGTLGNASAGSNRTGVMLFDASTTESVTGTFRVPPSWAGYGAFLWWANAGAGAGDVVWYHARLAMSDTTDTNAGGTAAQTTETASAQYVIKRTTLVANTTHASAGQVVRWLIVRLGGDAADTLANDVGVIGLELVRTS